MSIFNFKKRPLKVIITGGPRSGTSFLSGLVTKMGYSPGSNDKLKKGNQYNKYGYFEHEQLLALDDSIIKKLNADFHNNLPIIEDNTLPLIKKEMKKIKNIVHKDCIEVYKGNKLLVLSDIYDHLYPEAKWIYIERNIDETYKSRFGSEMSFEDWEKITKTRLNSWKNSSASKKSLNVHYDDFFNDLDNTITKIARFLDVNLSENQLNECKAFFLPSNK